MTQVDVPEVSRIERRCFSNPWPLSAYRRELRNPQQNSYLVLRASPAEPEPADTISDRPAPARHADGFWSLARIPLISLTRRSHPLGDGPHIAGFAGMWSVFDEAHVTTIGVDPHYRGRGFGELLLIALFDEAIRRRATWLTLEVRVSNEIAQRLYRKYGMSVQGTRRHYYSDNGEDAHVMWSRSLRDPDYRQLIDGLRDRLGRRLGREVQIAPGFRATSDGANASPARRVGS